jgi:hypothetical protein
MLINSTIVALKLVISSFVIPFYYGSGSSSGSGTIINYSSGSGFAKLSCGSYGSGSATLPLIVPIHCTIRAPR